MPGLGTIMNVAAIVVGGAAGSLLGSRLSERFQQTLLAACGVAVLVVGLAGAMQGMVLADGATGALSSGRALLVVISPVAGGVVGEAANLHQGINRFGGW